MQWAPGVTSVEFVPSMNGPACVHRATGKVFVNREIWDWITARFPDHHKDIKYFILLHEWAHIALKSRNEKLVDALAFEVYRRDKNRSHKAAVWALTFLLNPNNPQHLARMNYQFQRAAKNDFKTNQNQKLTPVIYV